MKDRFILISWVLVLILPILLLAPAIVSAQTQLPEETVPDNVKQLLTASWANWNALSDYQFTMQATVRKGNRVEKSAYHDYFKKPDMFRTDVTAGPKAGGAVVKQADGKIKGHQGGFLAAIILTLSPADKRLYDVRGNYFLEAEWSRHLKQIEDRLIKGARAALVSDTLDGQTVQVLTLNIADPADDVTQEIIWFDAAQKYIVKLQELAGSTIVLENIITDQKNNQDLPDSLFVM